MKPALAAAQCRDTFRRIVTDELALLGELDALLQEEHEHLVANDIEALERTGARRQDCVAALLRLGDERRDLCRLVGQAADAAGIAALLAACDPEGTLAPLLGEHAERSAACRARNERNGALVNARMARINNMLGMLAGQGSANVYAPSGARSPAAPTAGRLLVTRA